MCGQTAMHASGFLCVRAPFSSQPISFNQPQKLSESYSETGKVESGLCFVGWAVRGRMVGRYFESHTGCVHSGSMCVFTLKAGSSLCIGSFG